MVMGHDEWCRDCGCLLEECECDPPKGTKMDRLEMYYLTEFVVTEEHIKLLQNMYVAWWDCEYGAPCIDPKRPYGNSAVTNDIAHLLGWEIPEFDTPEWDALEKRAGDIHEEMRVVLQIMLSVCTSGIVPGLYKMTPKKVRQWARAWRD